MQDFILLMYNDAIDLDAAIDGSHWRNYLASLRASGQFDGGSSVGSGLVVRKGHADRPSTTTLDGFIRIRADGIAGARKFLTGNPVYEAGGTVEILELPPDM